jgi:hypothetical protein
MAPTTALGVDLAGRKISGTASGLLDAHAYLYNGSQAFVIGRVLDATGGNWMLVFLLLAASRALGGGDGAGESIDSREAPSRARMAGCRMAAPGLIRHAYSAVSAFDNAMLWISKFSGGSNLGKLLR